MVKTIYVAVLDRDCEAHYFYILAHAVQYIEANAKSLPVNWDDSHNDEIIADGLGWIEITHFED